MFVNMGTVNDRIWICINNLYERGTSNYALIDSVKDNLAITVIINAGIAVQLMLVLLYSAHFKHECFFLDLRS